MACQPIENLSGIGEICLQGVDIYCGVRKWHNVEIENFVTFTQEVGNNVFSSFSWSSRENLFQELGAVCRERRSRLCKILQFSCRQQR